MLGGTLYFPKSASALFCLVLLTSCEEPGSVGVRGVQPTLEQLNITNHTAAQNLLVNDLITKAGLTRTPGPRDSDWSVVTEAGIYEIGRQCDQYLDVLFRFNRRQQAVRQGLTAVGAATASILGIAGVAAPPIAITAAAFGLSASLFDAGVNSVLFTIEPSALRNVVLKGRKGYIDNLDLSKIDSRPRMMIALQGYLSQCSPAAIEANVNNAASGAPSVASTDPDVSARAAVLAAPASVLISTRTVRGPVTSEPRPLMPDELAGNAGPGEEGVRRRELVRVQEALGVKPATGNFGRLTREAITEFQRGAASQGKGGWTTTDINGRLTGRTRAVLPTIGAMPPAFQSPFERGLFGDANAANTADLFTRQSDGVLGGFLRRFNPPIQELPSGDTAAAFNERLDKMRARLGDMTTPKKATTPLTSQLHQEVLKSSEGLLGPRE